MIINHNISAMNTHRQLISNNLATSKSMEKLSSGFRINRASDDAAGLSISEKMRGQIRGMEQASRNAQDGISLIQTAEGALSTVNDMLVRVREIATQSKNGTYQDTDDRGRLNEELDEIQNQIKNVMDNTKFNGIGLLSGGSNITLQIGQFDSQTLTLDTSKFSLSSVQSTVNGWNISTSGGASTVLQNIEAQINAVSQARSYLGANQNRLEYTVNNLNITAENTQAAESRVRDVDMAKEMMQFTKNNILQQAAQSMLAQANQAPQNVLSLLR